MAAAGDRSLTLGTEAVSVVLRRLGSGAIDGSRAQRWASFMQLGHVPLAGADPIEPLDIDFEPDHEDEIADAIARLEEIGDRIDGDPPTAAEIQALLLRLEAPGDMPRQP